MSRGRPCSSTSALVPFRIECLQHINGLHAIRGQGDHDVEGQGVRIVPGVSHPKESAPAADAFVEAAGIGSGHIGTLQGGHQLLWKGAFRLQEARLHLGEDLLAEQDVALDGVVLSDDVALEVKAIVTGKGCSPGHTGDEVRHAVLAHGGVFSASFCSSHAMSSSGDNPPETTCSWAAFWLAGIQ